MDEHELRIEGMSCEHCVRTVERALRALDGVRAVQVEVGRARVLADPGVTRAAIAAVVEAEDFRVTG